MGLGAADFRIDDVVVGDVVAMGAAWLGSEIWRRIDGADAEPPQVRHDGRRGREGETRVHLQAIRARWNEARLLHHLLPGGVAPRSALHARSRGPRAPLRSRGSLASLVRASTSAPGRANAMVLVDRSITGGCGSAANAGSSVSMSVVRVRPR